MSNDELVWHVIGHNFCSFKAKVADNEREFCRNEHNVTGLCDRRSCPLANSRYATIREENGRAVLYVKTAERAHMPNRLWEKTILPQNYTQALSHVDSELAFWPKFLVHKNKQRLTKIHQMLIRMRKIRKEKNAPRMERVNQKDDRREIKREAKALTAAKLERSIEKELLERLKQGTYGDIYNYPSQAYEKALREADADFAENEVEEAEEEIEEETRVEFVEGDFSDNDDDEDDMEDWYEKDEPDLFGSQAKSSPAAAAAAAPSVKKRTHIEDDVEAPGKRGRPTQPPPLPKSSKKPAAPGPKKRGPVVEIEYETEEADQEMAASSQRW